jgi:signal transduction histidine kinase
VSASVRRASLAADSRLCCLLFCASLGGAGLLAALLKLDSRKNSADVRMLRARIAELEHALHHLEDAANRREEFIASFAHELKTPLTAIIGYADMLRSKDMAPKPRFTAAGYIFSEGKRLEAMSLKLMDIIVTGRQNF